MLSRFIDEEIQAWQDCTLFHAHTQWMAEPGSDPASLAPEPLPSVFPATMWCCPRSCHQLQPWIAPSWTRFPCGSKLRKGPCWVVVLTEHEAEESRDSMGHQPLNVGPEIASNVRKEDTMDMEERERERERSSSTQVRTHHRLSKSAAIWPKTKTEGQVSLFQEKSQGEHLCLRVAFCGAHFRVVRLRRAQGQSRCAQQGHGEARSFAVWSFLAKSSTLCSTSGQELRLNMCNTVN